MNRTLPRYLRPAALLAFVAVFAAALIAMPAGANPNNNLVNGVDVSNHQHYGGQDIDWAAVKGDNQRFAFVKATEGTDFTNPTYAQDAEQAKEAGLAVGAYHFARPGTDAAVQAKHFADAINNGPATNLPPVLDLEVEDGLGTAQLQDWTRTFLTTLEQETGTTPIVYTYRYFWSERMGDTDEFANYPLWLAAWQNNAPRPVGGWDQVDIWQRSDSGRVAGIAAPVDLNVFNGNQQQFARYESGDLDAAGGVLEQFQDSEIESEISESLEVLEQNNTALVAAIIGLASGIVNMPQLEGIAGNFGFDAQDAHNIADTVRLQVESGKLPVEDLNTMMVGDTYSVGDLLILLDNANKSEGSSQ